ncbi:MAG: hypothetical protein ACXVP4_11500 [Bacteroidia bacterium]
MSADYGFNSLRKIANIEISVAYLKNKPAENNNKKSSEYYLLKKEACELKALFFKNRDEKIETKYLELYKKAEKKLHSKIIQTAIKSEVARLNSTDLKSLFLKRKKNHECLYTLLSGNKNLELINGDYMYLMFTVEDRDQLKKHLAVQHIFTAIHWLDSHSALSEKILALPVDQRYDLNDMKKIAETVNLFYK